VSLNKDDLKKILLDSSQFRFACKFFDETKKISKEDFQFLLEIANLSPTSLGLEAYKMVILQNQSIRQEMMEHCWGGRRQFPGASHVIIFAAAKTPLIGADSEYIKHVLKDIRKMPQEHFERYMGLIKQFQEKDFRLTTDELKFHWAARQTYIVLANVMSAAATLGIDSCPIEGFNREAIDHILSSHNILDTDNFGTSVIVALGYRKEDPEMPKSRQALESKIIYCE
jgi:nitroreductase